MSDCPTCQAYDAAIAEAKRADWRRWRDLCEEKVKHQANDHVLHVAITNEQREHFGEFKEIP